MLIKLCYFFVIYIGILNLIMYSYLKEQFYQLKQTKEVHYLLPDTADCAVKMMFFKDSEGKALPGEVRKVCHWRQK